MAAELVLQKHPLHLHIELASANKALPLIDGKRIYILRRHCKSWYLDQGRQVEIKRYGFPVVPDFGGTAHAYCGTSLEACIGDLQEWWMKPHKEASIRGYIIKSRIRCTENLIIAGPYSPCLFRMGAPAGPRYLLQTLQGNLTRKEALRQWKKEEAEQKAAAMQAHLSPMSPKCYCPLIFGERQGCPTKPI